MFCAPCRVSEADPAAEKATAAKSVSVTVAEAAAVRPAVSPTAEDGPKSSWEKAERARLAAASRSVRVPVAAAGGVEASAPGAAAASAQPPDLFTAGGAAKKVVSAPDAVEAVQEDAAAVAAAAAAAKAQAAGERRNDEERIAAARERFLARKRKGPPV